MYGDMAFELSLIRSLKPKHGGGDSAEVIELCCFEFILSMLF